MANQHLESIQEYYARTLKTNQDLKTTACCSVDSMPEYIKPIAAMIHPEVSEKFYGCGVPLPQALRGKTILDLGCGSGRDCFILSKLVGPEGRIIGVDMTAAQLAVAQKFQTYHAERFGFVESNISFRQGYIEDLRAIDIADNSVDVVISNCVFNLSPDKARLYSEVFRVLKPGGELYFSDVFVDRRLPQTCQQDAVLLGECLGGAQYIEDFRRLMAQVGCADFRTVSTMPIQITDSSIQQKVANAQFTSRTIRAFKLGFEDRCEDYGQVAFYLGTIPDAPARFVLDDHHTFEAHRPMLVCGNTAMMLTESRFAPHFKVHGDQSRHFGLFDCGPEVLPTSASSGGACC